ncbi:hypothetical protein BN2497_12375 [Janthinobacterium sp. CG23_2]|nr:hypothetical protein BN2497_12375 [Janthinobacterium sp. CG23_2]CUU32585.1 hypothetical protein BN3177_12375 [Janthinobacterium sp. CG23_2]
MCLDVPRSVQHAYNFDATMNRTVKNNVALIWKASQVGHEVNPYRPQFGPLSQQFEFFIQPVNERIRVSDAVLRDEIPDCAEVDAGAGADNDGRHLRTIFHLGRQSRPSGALDFIGIPINNGATIQAIADILTELIKLRNWYLVALIHESQCIVDDLAR